MCGRFTQNYTWQEVHTLLDVFGTPRNLRPRYSIAPTTEVDVVRLDQAGQREGEGEDDPELIKPLAA